MFSLEAAIYGLAAPLSPQLCSGGLLPVVIATEFHSSKVNGLENKKYGGVRDDFSPEYILESRQASDLMHEILVYTLTFR